MDQHAASFPHLVTITGQRPRRGIVARIATLIAVHRTRQELARLTDTQLCDIGVTRAAVQAELDRPVWDVPANWRQR